MPEQKPPRQCPECGCDRWRMRDADRLYDANMRYSRQVEKLAAEKGILTHQMTVQEHEHRDHMARLSRKISRQARVIVRLEARLRALKARPYEDAPLGESAPAVEYDAAEGGGDA